MSHITAEEWQLLSLFAVEPTLSDADVPWCYNHAVYEVRQGPLVLRCAIDPAYRDVQIVIEHDSSPPTATESPTSSSTTAPPPATTTSSWPAGSSRRGCGS